MKVIFTESQLSFLLNEDIKSMSLPISYKYNPEVEELQKELISKDYYLGKFGDNKDGVDGKYGPFTKAAHEAYKKDIKPEEFNKNKELTQKYITDVNDDTLKNEFNFHKIPDGRNNYRSAQIPVSLNGKDYLGQIIDKYGIKKIIRLNGDGRDSKHRSSHPETSIQDEKEFAESKGIKFYKLSATRNQNEVNDLLSSGNVLIHCAHGADRTGGNVGGYLMGLDWPTDKIWDYTIQYNSWPYMIKNNPKTFVNGGYLKQAQKFGVRDLEHAKELMGDKAKGLKEYFDPIYFLKNKMKDKPKQAKPQEFVKYEPIFQKYVNIAFKYTKKQMPIKHLNGFKVLKVTPQSEWTVLICPKIDDWFNYEENSEYLQELEKFKEEFKNMMNLTGFKSHFESEELPTIVQYSFWPRC